MNFLRRCRRADKMISFEKKWFRTLFVLIIGVLLGVIVIHSNNMINDDSIVYKILNTIDVKGFSNRISFWLIIITLVSIYSNSPFRAFINILALTAGVLGGYYGYTTFIFNEEFVFNLNTWLINASIGCTISMILWYAKGEGWFSVLISSLLIAFLFRESFNYGIWFFSVKYIQEIVFLGLSIIVLFNNLPKTIITIFYSLPLAIVYEILLPYIGL
jgi:hypothetical protein